MSTPTDIAMYKITHLLENRDITRRGLRKDLKLILKEYSDGIKKDQSERIKQLEEISNRFDIVKKLLK